MKETWGYCARYTVLLFLGLWLTKPFTTGFTDWVPTLLGHVVIAATCVTLWLVTWLRTRRLRGPAMKPVRGHLRKRHPSCTCGQCRERGYAPPVTATPVATPPVRLDPRDGTDPFCTCPSCGLLANHKLGPVEHAVDQVWIYHPKLRRAIMVAPSAVPVHQLSGWELVPLHSAARRCVFCGHEWVTGPTESTVDVTAVRRY